MDGEGHVQENSDRRKDQAIGNWRKGDPGYEVAQNLAELCSCVCVPWKVALASDEIGYLDEEISKSVAGAIWLLTTQSKTQEERKGFQMELLSMKKTDLKGL